MEFVVNIYQGEAVLGSTIVQAHSKSDAISRIGGKGNAYTFEDGEVYYYIKKEAVTHFTVHDSETHTGTQPFIRGI